MDKVMFAVNDNPWLYMFAHLEFDNTAVSPEYVKQYLNIIRKVKALAVQYHKNSCKLDLRPRKTIRQNSHFVLHL